MGYKTEITVNLDRKKTIVAGIFVIMTLAISYSYLISLFAFDAPSQDYPLDIIQVTVLDNANVPTSTFNQGEIVRINCSIQKALRYQNFPFTYEYFDFVGDSSFKIIVTLMDGAKRPVKVYYSDNVLSPDATVAALYNHTLTNAPVGTYTIHVMIWSDWLPSGDALSPNVWEETFTVT